MPSLIGVPLALVADLGTKLPMVEFRAHSSIFDPSQLVDAAVGLVVALPPSDADSLHAAATRASAMSNGASAWRFIDRMGPPGSCREPLPG
jgi:hypothetical protein